MSFEAARADMVAAAQAALATWAGPTLPLAFQNQAVVDVARQTTPYLCVDLYMLDGEQLSFGQTKALADYGQIHLVAHAPQNGGTLAAQRILDHFRPYFELKTFALIRTHAAKGQAPFKRDGWEAWPLVIPFWYHRLVT